MGLYCTSDWETVRRQKTSFGVLTCGYIVSARHQRPHLWSPQWRMISIPACRPPSSFGRELARCRKERGLSQRRLADHLSCSPSLVGHIETGSRNPQLDFAEACDQFFNLPEKDYFARMCRRIHQSPSGPGWYLRWLEEIEPNAVTLRTWDPLLVPGLLQTEHYARAVFRPWPPGDTRARGRGTGHRSHGAATDPYQRQPSRAKAKYRPSMISSR
ncbi:Scr1 family TA system antitoxin-like transcriptional regulator [Nonomuraea sp. NPDC049714]|uniref:helix-turn-helix domain-containing protein n=1 Tax=Nonomuraea sp. NPDC049714 TaxID=3364357 RepID=UPI0037A59071